MLPAKARSLFDGDPCDFVRIQGRAGPGTGGGMLAHSLSRVPDRDFTRVYLIGQQQRLGYRTPSRRVWRAGYPFFEPATANRRTRTGEPCRRGCRRNCMAPAQLLAEMPHAWRRRGEAAGAKSVPTARKVTVPSQRFRERLELIAAVVRRMLNPSRAWRLPGRGVELVSAQVPLCDLAAAAHSIFLKTANRSRRAPCRVNYCNEALISLYRAHYSLLTEGR